MKINLHKDDKGRDNSIPLGPLYNMSRDELLVLRKTLSDHLEKGWIRQVLHQEERRCYLLESLAEGRGFVSTIEPSTQLLRKIDIPCLS